MFQYVGRTNVLWYDIIGCFGVVLLLVITYKNERCKIGETFLKCMEYISRQPQNNIMVRLLLNKKMWSIFEYVIIVGVQLFGITYASWWFAGFTGKATDYMGFVLVTPFLLIPVCVVLGKNWLIQMDNLSLIYPLLSSVLKIGCFCHGCCSGVEWKYGLYNYETGLHEFPVQIIESIFSFAVFILLKKIYKELKKGMLYPIFLLSYCKGRFVMQFLRVEETVCGIVDAQQIACIIGYLFGAIILLLMYIYNYIINKG